VVVFLRRGFLPLPQPPSAGLQVWHRKIYNEDQREDPENLQARKKVIVISPPLSRVSLSTIPVTCYQ
jgi:hypothetical protein